jgi:hypothetical protein
MDEGGATACVDLRHGSCGGAESDDPMEASSEPAPQLRIDRVIESPTATHLRDVRQ